LKGKDEEADIKYGRKAARIFGADYEYYYKLLSVYPYLKT
jgi:hypothetical protein